jgi:hypothetical protein
MKKTLILIAALAGCLIFGCKKKEKVSQTGVFKLEKQMVSGGGKDTIYDRNQFKIYTDHFFMYAGMAPDSSVGFGAGSYMLDTGNRLIERNIYSSQYLDSSKSFNVVITSRSDSGYTQVIPDLAVINGVNYKLTEVYSKLPSTDTSSMDGLWKLYKTYWVKGKDTTTQNETQLKIFWGGHFMFVHRYPLDQAATNFKNGFGYGTFTFKRDTLSELDLMSSHSILVGHKYSIKITFNGKDEYQQVIDDPAANERTIEIYRRVQ